MIKAVKWEKWHDNMITVDDKKILEMLANGIRKEYPGARIWVFGSRVRGDVTWESDFDIFIVLPEKNDLAEAFVRNFCWETGFQNDRVITSVIMDQNEFENGPMSESTLVENILREGVAA